MELSGKQVILVGERDGVPAPAMARCVEAAGGAVALSIDECFV